MRHKNCVRFWTNVSKLVYGRKREEERVGKVGVVQFFLDNTHRTKVATSVKEKNEI